MQKGNFIAIVTVLLLLGVILPLAVWQDTRARVARRADRRQLQQIAMKILAETNPPAAWPEWFAKNIFNPEEQDFILAGGLVLCATNSAESGLLLRGRVRGRPVTVDRRGRIAFPDR